jgi:DNA-directed RNA polymerase specialized sigma subunit
MCEGRLSQQFPIVKGSRKESKMTRIHYTQNQLIKLFQKTSSNLSQGRSVEKICQDIGVAEETYYHLWKKWGKMMLVYDRHMNASKKESTRLKNVMEKTGRPRLLSSEELNFLLKGGNPNNHAMRSPLKTHK